MIDLSKITLLYEASNWQYGRHPKKYNEFQELFLVRRNCYHYVGFEVLTAVSTKMAVFWVVAPCI
jgi:hypothetical protein